MDPDQTPPVPTSPQAGSVPPPPVPSPAVPPPAGPPPTAQPGPVRRTRRSVVVGAVAGGLALLLLCCAGTAVAVFLGRDRIFGGGSGSTTITVEAVGHDGGVPDAGLLEQTRKMLVERAEAAGLADPSVTRSGDRGLVVRVSGADQSERLRALVAVGELRFRQVLATTVVPPDTATSGPPPAPSPAAGPLPDRAEVIAKLGPAYETAQSLARGTAPPDQIDAPARQALAPFAALSPAEVAVLPVEIQYAVPQVTCTQLLARPVVATGTADEGLATTCDRNTPPNRYLLGAAQISGADVKDATATYSTYGQWVVTLIFEPAGQQRWTELTRAASSGTGGTNQVAIVVDDAVVSAPTVQGVLTGDTEISGGFTRSTAEELAAQLQSGALPVALRIVDLTTDPD